MMWKRIDINSNEELDIERFMRYLVKNNDIGIYAERIIQLLDYFRIYDDVDPIYILKSVIEQLEKIKREFDYNRIAKAYMEMEE